MKKVAIITVNYNGSDDTIEFLDSLKRLHPSPFTLYPIVVDNGSSDDSVEKILKKHPDIDLLQTGENKGFAGGYNRGIEHSMIWGADYLLIINNDTLISDPDLLTQLAKTLDENPKAGIVAPKIYFAPGYEFHKDNYTQADQGKVIWYAGGEFDWNNVYSIHHGMNEVDQGQYNKEETVSFVTACCWMIKREVIEKVGMFEEDLFAYFEDNDLCIRIQAAGYKLYYNGHTSLFHKVSQTSGIGSSFGDFLMTRNRLYFGMKYASGRTKFALYREALKFLLFGRQAQKKGVWAYFQGQKGPQHPQVTKNPGYQIKLSVVTLNYNTPDLIDNLLKSIYQQDSGYKNQPTEVIVLDNGSELGCADVVKKYPKARFIQNPVNTGFTGGNNKAIKYSRGEYILMLNSDIEATPNSLTNQLEAAEKYHGNAITSGALYFPDGTLQDSIFYLPTVWGAIKEYFFRIKGSFFMYAGPQDRDTKVEAAAMACFMIPRKILNKVGLLDERLFTYFEDVDFCRRCKKLGIPIYYTPKAKFLHLHGATSKRLKQGKAYELLVNASKLYHGALNYHLLTFTLRVAQKISGTQTPVAR
jgi:GT2 family glycosyltransferase